MTASPRTGIVPGTTARLTYPVFAVSGGIGATQDEIQQLLATRVTGLVDGYRSREGLRTARITATIGRWEGYLSVRLDVVADFGGAHGDDSTTALVVDTRTGAAAAPTDLFTDVGAVDDIMRSTIGGQPGVAGPAEVGQLTMRAGAPGGLAWYVDADGLHWVLDQCADTPCTAGQPEAVVAWPRLAALVKAGR